MDTKDLAKIIQETRENTKASPIAPLDAVYNAMRKLGYVKDKAKAESELIDRKKLALAQNKQIAHIQGYIKAQASAIHPLQTELEIFITDFLPNNNKQGIKRSEAENILRTAKNSPLKISFDGDMPLGHKHAYAVGSIVDVEDKQDRIIGRAVIWNTEYEDVAAYVKALGQVYTSWEMFYTDSSMENGTEWLQGCVFGGLCIVSNPAYGKDKAIAKIRA